MVKNESSRISHYLSIHNCADMKQQELREEQNFVEKINASNELKWINFKTLLDLRRWATLQTVFNGENVSEPFTVIRILIIVLVDNCTVLKHKHVKSLTLTFLSQCKLSAEHRTVLCCLLSIGQWENWTVRVQHLALPFLESQVPGDNESHS